MEQSTRPVRVAPGIPMSISNTLLRIRMEDALSPVSAVSAARDIKWRKIEEGSQTYQGGSLTCRGSFVSCHTSQHVKVQAYPLAVIDAALAAL